MKHPTALDLSAMELLAWESKPRLLKEIKRATAPDNQKGRGGKVKRIYEKNIRREY